MTNIELDKSKRIKRLGSLAKPLTAEHILRAIEKYNDKNGDIPSYKESTGYDLLHEGELYPPKAIFGLAMSELLMEEVKSSHFTGGEGSICFNQLRRLNFSIVEKPRPSEKNGLIVHREFTREMLCNLYDPELTFKPGSGKWGITGIITDTPVKNDFVFLVTLDEHADGNDYEDYLTKDGVLVWKSQNRNTPQDAMIQQLLSHDDSLNNVLLFMRPTENDSYTYMGPLKFRDWDVNSTNPVQISWDLKSWPLPSDVAAKFERMIRPAMSPWYKEEKAPSKTKLTQVSPPKVSRSPKEKTGTQKQHNISPNWDERDRRNRELGLNGEKLVIQYEKDKLIAANLNHLAAQVQHIALSNPSAGYDISSFDENEKPIFIEVKTTTGGINTPFFISKNEVDVSKELKEQYFVYRVFNFSQGMDKLDFYALNGPVSDSFSLEPTTYKALPN